MSIYSVTTGKSFETIESEFRGQGYGAFKSAVGESVAERLRPIREKADALMQDKTYLTQVYTEAADRAARVADKTLKKVQKKVGFVVK
jgi:tryptophanyl-tRNA synthetase